MFKHSTNTVPGKTASKGAAAPLRVAVALEAFRHNEALLAALDTSCAGLNEEQIAERLDRDGVNEVSHEKPPHWALQLLHAFKNPFIVVLLVLAGVQLATDHTNLTGPTIIAVMVSISVLLSFTQEYRSSKAAEKLKAMVRNTATVTRRASDGHSERIEVPVGELVAGDIVHLAAGDMVPADLRLLSAKDLFISQAILTGESLPVEKSVPLHGPADDEEPGTADNPLDLATVCYMGTNVVSGTAAAVIVATGSRSYLGSIARTITGSACSDQFRSRRQERQLAVDPLHAGDGADRFPDQRSDKHDWLQAFLFALVGRRGSDARDAADDRYREPGQGCHRDVAPEGGGEAAQRDPELRRDGRAVHRQDRHADARQDRAGAPPRSVR